MKARFVIFLCCLVATISSTAQSKQALENFENQLKPLMDTMTLAKVDNQRFNANEKFITLLEEVLSYPKTFSYPFEKLKHISILSPSDKRFRIYTWNIVNDYGEYENYGFVQSENKDEKEMQVFRLYDRSDEIPFPENAKLDDSLWFGAVYYEVITTKFNDVTLYTLLGWDGKDIYSQRKIIEPISIKNSNGKPSFGAAVFYKEKDRKRCIFEYAPNGSFNLRWDNQFVENVARKKVKEKGKLTYAADTTYQQQMLIVYDSLQSMYEGFESLPQYQIAAYSVNGFKFDRGKWSRLTGVVPRNKPNVNDKMNADPKKQKENVNKSNTKQGDNRLF